MGIQIIGVAGTNGSGKDTVMQFLAANYNYLSLSATDMLRTELEHRGQPTDRLHKAALAAEWRREDGMAVIVHKAHDALKQAGQTYAGLVVGSLRHPAEADAVHQLGGTVIWVDADPHLRYDRVQAGLAARGGRLEDQVSFDQFLADEAREMHPVGDAATLNMAAVKELADLFLLNEDGFDSFKAQIQTSLQLARQ